MLDDSTASAPASASASANDTPSELDIDMDMLAQTGIAFTHEEANQIRRQTIMFQNGITDPAAFDPPATYIPIVDQLNETADRIAAGHKPPAPPLAVPTRDGKRILTPRRPDLNASPTAKIAHERRRQAHKKPDPQNPTTKNGLGENQENKNNLLRFIPPSEYTIQVNKILSAHIDRALTTNAHEYHPARIHPGRQTLPVPSTLTPERFGRLLSAIEQGMSRKGAAALVGINQHTFNQWQLKASQGEAPYEELFALVQFAESRIELYMLSSWVRAADTDWKAAQSYLERRFPQDWGARPQVTLTLPKLDALSDDELEQIKGDVAIIEMSPSLQSPTTNPNHRSSDPNQHDIFEFDQATTTTTTTDQSEHEGDQNPQDRALDSASPTHAETSPTPREAV